MSSSTMGNNGKWLTAADLDNGATIFENVETVTKHFIKKMLHVFNSIMTIVQRKEDGIFSVVLKWFRLYLRLHLLITPDNKKVLKYYEKSVPTIITYIIGCLQYKAKEVPNYHYNLLEILEELIENVQPIVLKQITKFEKGTIGCLWNPIDLAGDFNTQLKALKIFSVLLKQFDKHRQNEELKSIKWTNLNLFQDKLKAIVEEAKLPNVLENNSRELLNNYNMNLSKCITVYSFYCKSVILGNKYKFYKPLNLEKFWIDINYSPKTVSYTGRFKLSSNSNYDIINVVLKIQSIILANNTLEIYFNSPGNFSKYSDYLSNVADNIIQFSLTNAERCRLENNNYVIDYFNSYRRSYNAKCTKADKKDTSIFDLLKNDMTKALEENKSNSASNRSNLFKKSYNFHVTSTPEESVNCDEASQEINALVEPSTNAKKDMKKFPLRNLRNRNKIFKSLVLEESCDKTKSKKTNRIRSRKPNSRQRKSKSKQVCKVIPTVDMAKIENDSINQNDIQTKVYSGEAPLKDNVLKQSFPLMNTQVCNEVLKKVADIYDNGDTTYAKPCQSYKSYQTHLNPSQNLYNIKNTTKAKGRKKKIDLDSESSVEKKRKLSNCHTLENKENINPQSQKYIDTPCISKAKGILSPHLFETQCSDEIHPANELPVTKNRQTTIVDLTVDEIEEIPNCCEQKQNEINISHVIFPENIEINLALDEIEQNQIELENNKENNTTCLSLECEEVRGLNETDFIDINYIFTPSKSFLSNGSSSSMNISNLDNSDMELSQAYNYEDSKEQQLNNHTEHSITQDDMQLTKFCNNLNLSMDQQSKKNHKNATDLKKDSQDLKENCKLPIYLEQIINDFDYDSINDFDSSYNKTPSKVPYCDIIGKNVVKQIINDFDYDSYYDIMGKNVVNNQTDNNYDMNCVVFQNRNGFEDWTSSDESDDSLNSNSKIMQNLPSFLRSNLRQERVSRTTPEKNYKISKNSTTVTKCEVTPTAIIMQQYQVSATKSLVLQKQNFKKIGRASKCLNNFFLRDNIIDAHEKSDALQNQHSNNFKERNSMLLPHKNQIFNTKPPEPRNANTSHHPENFKFLESSSSLIHSANANSNNNNTLFNTGSDYKAQEQSRSNDLNFTDQSENNLFNCKRHNRTLENFKSSLKNEMLTIINDYNANIKQRFNNAFHLSIKNIADIYTRNFLNITKSVLQKSDENQKELEQIRSNIDRLVRELEWHYDAFINKSKELKVDRLITEQVLESISNADSITNSITNDYDNIFKQINVDQEKIFEKLWQKYLDKY